MKKPNAKGKESFEVVGLTKKQYDIAVKKLNEYPENVHTKGEAICELIKRCESDKACLRVLCLNAFIWYKQSIPNPSISQKLVNKIKGLKK